MVKSTLPILTTISIFLLVGFAWLFLGGSASAAAIDPYVVRYLKATQPVAIQQDASGQTKAYTPQDLSEGKQFFEQNCLLCHVGGETLPNPAISLSLADLQGATPPRNNIQGIVDFLREPTAYDGSGEEVFCRQVTEDWISQERLEPVAAFIIRAAEVAPAWGTKSIFKDSPF